MSQEILYTSAPAGLKRGSQGFCTVVSTTGMAVNLAQQLEMLSGYRQAFPLNDSRAKLNPVNYSHLILQVGGRRFDVLSRIADAGLDYTQRNNKLAHHVAMEELERVAAGPAAVLASPGFCETSWDGEPRKLAAGRTPTDLDEATGPCLTWESVTGDAGWAGVIAEYLLKEREKPISIIFPAGTQTLDLAVEVMSLIPARKRWDVTFSTYFTTLPAGLQCQLRFVLDETKEATALRRHPHVQLLDLCQDLGSAAGGQLVETARVGRTGPQRPQTKPPQSPPPVREDVYREESFQEEDFGEEDSSVVRETGPPPTTYAVSQPATQTARRRSRPTPKSQEPGLPPDEKQRSRLRLILLIAGPLLVMSILAVSITLFLVFGDKTDGRGVATTPPSKPQPGGPKQPRKQAANSAGTTKPQNVFPKPEGRNSQEKAQAANTGGAETPRPKNGGKKKGDDPKTRSDKRKYIIAIAKRPARARKTPANNPPAGKNNEDNRFNELKNVLKLPEIPKLAGVGEKVPPPKP
ncbi:MAG: hypothetical protein IID45_11740, partial [Planctomycetes bacterium]|nr:hypothetical protein [Planctomycetota bacterium]